MHLFAFFFSLLASKLAANLIKTHKMEMCLFGAVSLVYTSPIHHRRDGNCWLRNEDLQHDDVTWNSLCVAGIFYKKIGFDYLNGGETTSSFLPFNSSFSRKKSKTRKIVQIQVQNQVSRQPVATLKIAASDAFGGRNGRIHH